MSLVAAETDQRAEPREETGSTNDDPVPHGSRLESVPLYPADEVLVPGSQAWVDTGIDVQAGEALQIVADGGIRFRRRGLLDHKQACAVGPEGTYLFDDKVAHECFPLPAGAEGPAPAYCLIGRIGDGEPFYVGPRMSWKADRSGRLLLGINDFDVSDNCGQFVAEISKPLLVQPMRFEDSIPAASADETCCVSSAPCEGDYSVVVFYLDGLRPDVVREMAAMGHIPHIDKYFIRGGVWLANTFTAFPSDTITSNGTMWTGCFSDRHGLKGQVRFSRRTLRSDSYLETLGPYRGATLLSPRGIDRFVQNVGAASVGQLQGEEAEQCWWQRHTSGVAPLFECLGCTGHNWATGLLPLMNELPPLLWTRSLMRNLPYFQMQRAWQYIDDANTHYALWHLLDRDSPVTVIWMPETDSVSHKQCRGQFGMTRRTIAEADQLIGRVIDELNAEGRLETTYLILVSDHGHHGGRETHLSNFDLADELFYNPRRMTPQGEWIGGGMGLSVRMHRFWNRHRGDGKREFVFIDGDSTGAARIFLPRGSYRSGDWSGPNRPGDLFAYPIDDCLPPVNLVDTLTAIEAVHGNGCVQRPVDLVLVKLDECSILIATADRGDAVIDRQRDDCGNWVYRYRPVEHVTPTTDGDITYRIVKAPSVDPLGLLKHFSARQLASYHNEATWLRLTAPTRYPDGVVAMTRHMLWQENIRHREHEFAPDLVVTARPGWYFGVESSPGTMHGYPAPDSMRASLFISGPNVRRGARIDDPCRLADLTPTILDMVGVCCPADDFDGKPIRTIYESPEQPEIAAGRPVFFSDLDLGAWQPLPFTPRKQYDHLPVSINHPYSPFDLNNIAYDLVSVGDINVLRLADDVLFPFSNRDWGLLPLVENIDRRARHMRPPSLAEAARTLNLSGVAVSDYSATSAGNLKRADRAVDWVQRRAQTVDQTLADQVGRASLPGSPQVHAAVDGVQAGFWEVYLYAQRIVIQVVDEMLLSGFEDDTARVINSFRAQPAEITVPSPESRVKSPETDSDSRH